MPFLCGSWAPQCPAPMKPPHSFLPCQDPASGTCRVWPWDPGQILCFRGEQGRSPLEAAQWREVLSDLGPIIGALSWSRCLMRSSPSWELSAPVPVCALWLTLTLPSSPWVKATENSTAFHTECVCVCVWITQFCDPMDCSPPVFSVHGVLQARILEWVANPLPRGSSWPRDRTWVFRTAGGFFTVWAMREARSTWQSTSTPYLLLLIPRGCLQKPVLEWHLSL